MFEKLYKKQEEHRQLDARSSNFVDPLIAVGLHMIGAIGWVD